MAVVNTTSDLISNVDGQFTSRAGIKLNATLLDGGRVREKVAAVAVGATDSDTSTYRFVRVGSGVRITSIQLINDALGAGATIELGLYNTAANGGAAVSAALFDTGVSVAAAGGPTEHRYSLEGAATVENTVWQLLGLSADPLTTYDLVATLTATGGNAGSLAALVKFADSAG